MKLKDLIKKLQEYPDDYNVTIGYEGVPGSDSSLGPELEVEEFVIQDLETRICLQTQLAKLELDLIQNNFDLEVEKEAFGDAFGSIKGTIDKNNEVLMSIKKINQTGKRIR